MCIPRSSHIGFILLFLFGLSEIAQAQLGSFANRKKYIVESDSVSGSSDLVDFPVLISITDPEFAYNATPGTGTDNINGFDIAFTADDGTTELDFELESYNSGTGEIIFWVRFPTLSPATDTQFFIYYGDATITTDQSSTSTWDSNYQLVMHMDDVTDATSNSNDGTNNGTVSATGFIGNGRDFEYQDSDFITVADDPSLDITGEITISFWYNPESTVNGDGGAPDLVTKGTNASYEAAFRGGPRMQFRKNGGNNLNAAAAFNVTASTWYYFNYVQTSTGRIIYQDGTSIRTDANITAFATNNDDLQISRSGDAADGIMDEVRISDIARSADWIATEYNNQLSPGAFIEELDDIPGLSNIETDTQFYTAGGSDVFITNTLLIGDHPTVSTFDSAIVQITANLDGVDDNLNFTDGVITGTYTPSTGKLLLTGTADTTDYKSAIRSITYSNDNLVSPGQLTRTISITAYDGNSPTNTATRDLDVIITLSDLTTDISDNVFHLDAQDVDGDGIANTADGATISTWTDLNTTNNFDFDAGTAPVFDTDGFGERGSVMYDGGTSTLLTRASDVLINNSIFSQKSFALVFRTGSDITGFQVIFEQSNGTQGYNFTLEDGVLYAQAYSRNDDNWGSTNPIRHKSINLGAVQTNSSYTLLAYHDSNLWTAQVNESAFSSFTDAGPMPANGSPLGLGGNSDNTKNPVTLSNENGFFTGQIGEIASWNTVLSGGQIASLNTYFNDRWGNTAPILGAIEGTNIDFTEGDPDTVITSTIAVTDGDPHENMDSAKVSVTANFVTGTDSLIFVDTGNITGSYDGVSGVLTLSGSDTKANYQTALRSVFYRNSSTNPTVSTRTIEFEIYDWDDVSNTQSRNINVIDIASTPILADIEADALSYNEGDGAVAITSAIALSDFDDTDMESATISITANYTLGEDFLDFTDTGNITGSFASGTGILTLSGTDTKANYQAALQAVTYENTSSDPVELTRTISFVVNDGDNDSNTETRDITVVAANSAPILSSIESDNLSYPSEAVQITNTIVVSDPDDTFLDSAIVVISENLKPAEDSLIYSTIFGITGTYDTGTGRLKLIGNNLLSDYESALRSVHYKNFATIPSGTQRVVSFIVSDGSLKSDSLKRTIDVSPVESIPNLEVWLRADAGISEGDGVAVTTWADQSGNGNDYVGTAGTGTAPTYIASSSGLNSQPSVQFAGNGDHFLDSDGDVNYIDNASEFSLFIVYQSDVTNTDRGLFIAETPANDDKTLTIRYDASGANGNGAFSNIVKTGILANGADNQLESFSDIQTTDAQIISLQWESGITYDLYVDGILNNPSSAADPPPSGTITAATTAILGKGGKDDPQNSDLSWDGEIAEFIYYSRSITQTERESIEDYLADKYDQAIRKITPATGGETISADDANTTYTALSGPFVQEGFIGEFTASGTFILNTPSGYEWNTSATIGVTESPAFGGSTELMASYNAGSSSSTTLQFDIDAASTTNPGQLEFTGLEIRPTSGTIPNTGNITNTGTTGQGGTTNYGTITMVAGANDSLIFVQQPTATNVDSIITPAVRVQLVDQYGNSIEQSGVDISLALASGSTGNLSQTTPIQTNALGIAEFDTLSVDDIGTKELVATSSGLSPDTSSTFEIVNAGTLTGFTVERVPSGSISSKTAGQTFNIIITAVDGTSTTITTFNGTVVISSSCTMGTGQGTTGSFTNGVLESTTVSLTSVGTCDITATNSSGSETGTSNTFTVSAGAASEVTSTITASPTVILNDGITTSTITVALKDVYGNDLTTGGDVVALSITPTALGSLGSVTDVGDGTYTATLTSSTTEGTDNITGTVNAATITDDADVEYALFSHIWDSQLGSASDASNWEDVANWNVGTQPGASSVVFIPASPDVGNEQPVIDEAGSTVASVTMETGASLTISGGINFTITGDLSGGSILGTNADSLTVGGDVLNVTTINVGTVILNGSVAQSITDPHSYTNLVIDNASGVSVEENLVISDSLKLESGELFLPSGTNLIAEGISYGSGSLRFQRTITGDIGWRMLSSPVSSTFGDLLDGVLTQGYSGAFYDISSSPGDTVQSNVIYYVESYDDSGNGATDNQRFRAPTSSAESLTAGQGIFVFFFGDVAADSRYNDPLPDTMDVSGQEFGLSGEVDFGITYTTTADSGWNLVGNPFGATIDWDDSPNWTKTNVDGTIYVWDPAANGGDGEYLTWNGSTGTLGSGLIAPFQGFWVKANDASPDLRVTTDAKTTGGSFLRKEIKSPEENPMFELELNIDGLQKKTSLLFTDEGRMGKDLLDGFTLLPLTDNRLDLHTLLDDGASLAINHLPTLRDNRIVIPLVIRGYIDGEPISGEYLLRFINADNLPDDWLVLLIDKETGNEVNLVTNEEQRIFHTTRGKAKVGNPLSSPDLVFLESLATRYTLMITTEEIEANIPRSIFLDQNYPNPFNPSTTIPFGLNETSNVELTIYDILGRKVQTLINGERSAGRYEVTFNSRDLSSGVYFYRLVTDERTLTKRFTLIK
ncbi:MAG: DUF2341 domain-containing protein [Balneola sp.]|nr:MAG: DUF2341 domain-containing protein [Balneola sp.]